MSVAAVPTPKPKLSERDTAPAKVLRFLMRAPVNLILVLLGVLWLIPTLGLFLTSILPAQAFTVKGWWQIFTEAEPSRPGTTTARSCTTTRSCTHS